MPMPRHQAPGHPAGHPEADSVFRSTGDREFTRAHLPETGEHLAGVTPGELDRVFPQPRQALGEAGHGRAVVAVVLGAARKQVAAETLQRRLQLLVAGEVQGLETVDERGQPVECTLVEAVFRAVDGDDLVIGGRAGGRVETGYPEGHREARTPGGRK